MVEVFSKLRANKQWWLFLSIFGWWCLSFCSCCCILYNMPQYFISVHTHPTPHPEERSKLHKIAKERLLSIWKCNITLASCNWIMNCTVKYPYHGNERLNQCHLCKCFLLLRLLMTELLPPLVFFLMLRRVWSSRRRRQRSIKCIQTEQSKHALTLECPL